MRAERDRPRAHLVVDDFFAQPALDVILREVRALEPQMKTGLVRDIGHDGQSVFFEHPRRRNKAVWIHDPSKTLRLFREQLWSEPMLDAFEQADVYWGAFYLSRILTQNLRCLVAAQGDLEMGRIRIRRRGALEVYGRVRLGAAQARVGFRLLGPDAPLTEALSLFVETGRGATKAVLQRILPPEASERARVVAASASLGWA